MSGQTQDKPDILYINALPARYHTKFAKHAACGSQSVYSGSGLVMKSCSATSASKEAR